MITDCPEPSHITRDVQQRAAEELAGLSEGSALAAILAASLIDRDKLRACRGIRS